MIKLKKPEREQQKTFFIYKNIDMEFTLNIRSHWDVVWDNNHGLEFVLYFGDRDKVLTLYSCLTSQSSFVENSILFQMFRINSLRMNIYNVLSINNTSLKNHIYYTLCFYPTRDTGFINPYTVIRNPKAFQCQSNKPYEFQELVFPKLYTLNVDNQGLGTWNSCNYNTLFHDIPACIQLASPYSTLPAPVLKIADFVVDINVSFKGKAGSI
jgi:hypothetical protein